MQVVRLLTVAAFAGSSRHLPISPIHLASNGCWVWLVAARTNSTLQGTVNILLRASETQTHTEGLDRGEVWSYRGLGQRRGMELQRAWTEERYGATEHRKRLKAAVVVKRGWANSTKTHAKYHNINQLRSWK